MKSSNYFENYTLQKISNAPEEQDLNNVEAEDGGLLADSQERGKVSGTKCDSTAAELSCEIIRRFEEYLTCKDSKSVLHNIKDLQTEWDRLDLKIIDAEDIKKYNKLVKKYFSKLKFIQQKEDWRRWENYTNKLLLCEKIEELAKEADTFKVAREIKSIWEDWRSIGHAPKEKNDEIWDRFNSVRQSLKVRCNDFFKQLKIERSKNTTVKIELCKKAEQLQDSIDWEETADELKEIQKVWKETGPAEKKVDDELYHRFRSACNKFFDNRIQFYKKLHQRQNFSKKEKKYLLEEVEKLSEMNWKDAFKAIRILKDKWRNTGVANRQDEQRLSNRFYAAIDNYIDNLNASMPENLNQKEEICTSLNELIQAVEQQSLSGKEIDAKHEELKKAWENIGPVPKENEKELSNKFDRLNSQVIEQYQNSLKKHADKVAGEIKSKEEIIVEIEGLACENNFKENFDKFKLVCKKWPELNAELPENIEEKLNTRFVKVCEAFEKEDSSYFAKADGVRQENLKRKIKVCVELEKLADISVSSELDGSNLAEELMFAISGNFGDDKKTNSGSSEVKKKYAKLKKEWESIGVVPLYEFDAINSRYNNACSKLDVHGSNK